MKRESDGAPGDLASLENERQIYKSVLEGGDIPLQGLSGLKRPSSSASTKGNWAEPAGLSPGHTCYRPDGSYWEKLCHGRWFPGLWALLIPSLISHRPFFFRVLIFLFLQTPTLLSLKHLSSLFCSLILEISWAFTFPDSSRVAIFLCIFAPASQHRLLCFWTSTGNF